jgi:hypothetical protein
MSHVAYVGGQYVPHAQPRFRNDLRDGIVYLQITHGIAPHDHAFPRSVNPVLVVMSPSKKRVDPGLPMAASR